MIRTFKFRYVNEIVGVFVLTVVGFVIAGIVIALRSKDLFQPAQRITVNLPVEGSLGLKPGSTVFILGSDVGAVETINYKNGRLNAVITIRGQLIELVRDDTYAVISKSLGIGETYMTLERANPEWEKEAPLPANQPIPAISEAGTTDRIQQVLTQVQQQAVPAIGEAREAIRQYTALAASLTRTTTALEKGDSLVGRLLTDKKFADQIDAMLPKVNASLDEMQTLLKDLRKTSGNLADLTGSAKEDMKKLPELLDSMRATMDEMQAVMKDVRKSTARLPDVVDGANQTVQSLPGLVVQMQETMRQTQILIEGFQKSWLVRGNIDKSEPTGRIRPEEIGGGK